MLFLNTEIGKLFFPKLRSGNFAQAGEYTAVQKTAKC